MAKKITIELSHQSIQNAITELENYNKSLIRKTKEFTEELANIGVKVAINNDGHWGQYIEFSKNIRSQGAITKAYVIAKNISLVEVQWDVGSSTMNPVLMAEFGSGRYADDKRGKKFGAGRGTHPQGRKNRNGVLNALDPDGWYWSEDGGKTFYHSFGYKPTAPMSHAMNDMFIQIGRVGKKVFGG